MSYMSQAQLANDTDFMARISSAAAGEVPHTHQPQLWARDNIYWISAAPGFAAAYESALAADVDRPGMDPAVISDGQILSAVQVLVTEQFPPSDAPPDP